MASRPFVQRVSGQNERRPGGMECADRGARFSGNDQRCWSAERKVESCGCVAARRGSRPGVPRTTPATTTAADEPLSPLGARSAHLVHSHVTWSVVMSARLPANPFLLLVAASACWGVGTVLSKLALDRGIAPITLLAVEMGASSTVLLLALLVTTRFRPQIEPTVDLGRLVALGALNPALGYALALFGLVTVSASLAVLVWAIEPVIVILLAVPLLRERTEGRTVALVLVAVAGALLVLQGPGAQRPGRWNLADAGGCSRLRAVHGPDASHDARRRFDRRGVGPAGIRLRARPAGARRGCDHRLVQRRRSRRTLPLSVSPLRRASSTTRSRTSATSPRYVRCPLPLQSRCCRSSPCGVWRPRSWSETGFPPRNGWVPRSSGLRSSPSR